MVAEKNLLGIRFGRWTALEKVKSLRPPISYWKCRCDCGTLRDIPISNLTTSKTHGCRRCAANDLKTHGHYRSKIYATYNSMIQRCFNPSNPAFVHYGGRGISVCLRWKKSFENFLKDMGYPGDGLTLDRIDNDLGYSKENCRWVDRKIQSQNRRISIFVGEISNGWRILNRIEHTKKYHIECNDCGFVCEEWGCNFRKIKKHMCSNGTKND